MSEFRPLRDSTIKAYDLDDEVMLYGSGGELVYSLNASAKKIWELCDGTRNVAEISERLADSIGVDPRDLRPDIETAIQGFLDGNLLVAPES